MRYRAQYDIEAERIVELEPLEVGGTLDLAFAHGIKLLLENGGTFKATRELIIRHVPAAGDFLVTYDGFTWVEPNELFKRKYRAENLCA